MIVIVVLRMQECKSAVGPPYQGMQSFGMRFFGDDSAEQLLGAMRFDFAIGGVYSEAPDRQFEGEYLSKQANVSNHFLSRSEPTSLQSLQISNPHTQSQYTQHGRANIQAIEPQLFRNGASSALILTEHASCTCDFFVSEVDAQEALPGLVQGSPSRKG